LKERISGKNRGYKKNERTEKILGCTIIEFKKHLESKFSDGMCWDNQGDWHLDHIRPVSWANDEYELLELNHFTNFQPLWSHDNLSKGNRWGVLSFSKTMEYIHHDTQPSCYFWHS
jgi:hypothetical protein